VWPGGEEERDRKMASFRERVKISSEELAEVQKWWLGEAEKCSPKRKEEYLTFYPCFAAFFEIQEGRAEIENYITKKGDGDFYNARAKILQAEVRIKLYFSLKERNRL
jgi:hypothetical protein